MRIIQQLLRLLLPLCRIAILPKRIKQGSHLGRILSSAVARSFGILERLCRAVILRQRAIIRLGQELECIQARERPGHALTRRRKVGTVVAIVASAGAVVARGADSAALGRGLETQLRAPVVGGNVFVRVAERGTGGREVFIELAAVDAL